MSSVQYHQLFWQIHSEIKLVVKDRSQVISLKFNISRKVISREMKAAFHVWQGSDRFQLSQQVYQAPHIRRYKSLKGPANLNEWKIPCSSME